MPIDNFSYRPTILFIVYSLSFPVFHYTRHYEKNCLKRKRPAQNERRYIASTLLNNKGFDERHIEAALAHVKDGVAGVYNKAQYLQDRKYIMQWYADHLEQLADDKVIQFKKAE